MKNFRKKRFKKKINILPYKIAMYNTNSMKPLKEGLRKKILNLKKYLQKMILKNYYIKKKPQKKVS